MSNKTSEDTDGSPSIMSVDAVEQDIKPKDESLKPIDPTDGGGFPVDPTSNSENADDFWEGDDFRDIRGKNDLPTIGIKKGVRQK